jgi:hypothetical protein
MLSGAKARPHFPARFGTAEVVPFCFVPSLWSFSSSCESHALIQNAHEQI